MTAVTIDFPATLTQQIEAQGISQAQLQAVILRFVELYVSRESADNAEHRQWTSVAEFANRLLVNNRELFEELAKF